MAVDNFIYQGINRAISDFAGSRMCEELINLRPTEGGVVPVKDFTVKLADMPFRKLFVHHTTDGDKYIAIRVVDNESVLVDYVDGTTGETIKNLFNTPWDNGNTVESIFFASTGNILLLSLCDKYSERYANKAYLWKGGDTGTYREMEAEIPAGLTYTISDGTDLEVATQNIAVLYVGSSREEVASAVENGLSAVQENNPSICIGTIIIAVAYKTTDGNTFWTGDWRVYDPTRKIGTTNPPYFDVNNPLVPYMGDDATAFLAQYGHGYLLGSASQSKGLKEIEVYGTKVSLSFPKVTDWDEDTSIIQSVEVYCSKPQLYLDTANAMDALFSVVSPAAVGPALVLPQRGYEDMDLGGQRLYHQASVSMASLSKEPQTVDLTFGGNIQVTEDTLDTDAGALRRYGRLLSYNARFHFYDSVSRIDVGMPTFHYAETPTGSGISAEVFVRYADPERDELVWVGTATDYAGEADIVIAPTINAKEVIVYFTDYPPNTRVHTYRMTPSSSYNFSISVGKPNVQINQGTLDYLERLIPANRRPSGITVDEKDTINVTEQYNPFVFRVEHSYKAPGNIIDVQPQMAGITDVSYGLDPLTVSTERGLYNLTLGSANVLYGAFVPVSNIVAKRGGIPTEMGVFFLGDGGLWLLTGRRATLISDALSQGPHKYVRASTGYKKLSGVDENFSPTPAGTTPPTPFYDVSPYVSQIEFNDFARDGRLAFNRFRMEIFISNESYDYTYVISLKYRQWHKLSQRLWQDSSDGIIVIRPGGVAGTITILDMENEVSGTTLVHLQSRPFSMGFQYSHIHRILAMVRAKLSGTSGQRIALGLYGSDNLQDWKLLAYAKRSGSTTSENETTTDAPLFISQVRTPSAARSWRYYTVCIGGLIQAGGDFPTDIGPFIVDYEPVIRRIG